MFALRPTMLMPRVNPGAPSQPLNGTVLCAASGTLTAGVATHLCAAWPAADTIQVIASTATEAMPRRTKLLLLIRNLLFRTTRRGNPTLRPASAATATGKQDVPTSSAAPSRPAGDSTILLRAPLTKR